jgi:hypothetical protein
MCSAESRCVGAALIEPSHRFEELRALVDEIVVQQVVVLQSRFDQLWDAMSIDYHPASF